jgi:hypothetical protein
MRRRKELGLIGCLGLANDDLVVLGQKITTSGDTG